MTQGKEFKGRQFTAEVILWAVRWYLMFPISYRDLELMLLDRGVEAGRFSSEGRHRSNQPTCPSTLPSCRRREMMGAPLLPAQCNRSERVHKALFRTRTEAKEAVFEYTEVFYDRHRLPSALARISHTFCDTEAIRSEKVSRCKSLTAVGQADPFRQSVVQPSGGRLMDIG